MTFSTIQDYIDSIQAQFVAAGEPAPPRDFHWEEATQLGFFITALLEKLDDVPDSFFAGLTAVQKTRLNLVTQNIDPTAFQTSMLACLTYLNVPTPPVLPPGEEPPAPIEDPTPMCADVLIEWWWFEYWTCITYPACIWKFLGMDHIWFNYGMCLPSGTPIPPDDDSCECQEVGIPTEVILAMIAIATIWCGAGPVVGTLGRELLRRIALRVAAAGA